MVVILRAPENDRFQVVAEHQPENHIAAVSYLGIDHTQDCVFIQLTLNAGRTVEQKRGFEVAKENWSFGNGDAPYAS